MVQKPAKKRDRRALLGRLFDAINDPAWGTPDAFDPDSVRRWLGVIGRMFGPGRYFRLETQGFERLPPPPVLVVANHSGGTTIPDAWGLGISWYRHFGLSRPLHPLAHDMIFALRLTGEPFSRLGALRAHSSQALEALLRCRRDVLVMPGGDVETWRPFRDRYRVRWSGRRGYARLALRAGVPIVPIACTGAHSTLYVFADGRRFARLIGLHKLARAEVFPVHLSLPWGLAVGPLPHLPLPTTLHFQVGEPVAPPSDGPVASPTDEQIAALDTEVRARMQDLLDGMADEARARR